MPKPLRIPLPIMLALVTTLSATAVEPPPAQPLTWAPPVLVDPTTVQITEDNRNLKLDKQRDYHLLLPTDRPLLGGLTIYGGRNVVLIGGVVQVPTKEEAPDAVKGRRALYLKAQTGTIHLEGIHFRGEDLAEGINLDQREGAIVQLQNLRFDLLHGTRKGHHSDLVQTWAGPRELRIDGLTGSTSYQGFFLLPNQHFDGPQPERWDFRRMDITGTQDSAYLLWSPDETPWPIELTEVWLQPSPKKTNRDGFLWPKPSTGNCPWESASVGPAPAGEFVPEERVGLGYVSPGYVTER